VASKLHLLCDGQGRSLSLVLTGVQRHESTLLNAGLAGVQVPRIGPGRLRAHSGRVLANKGFS
jgi:hypothetical protein